MPTATEKFNALSEQYEPLVAAAKVTLEQKLQALYQSHDEFVAAS